MAGRISRDAIPTFRLSVRTSSTTCRLADGYWNGFIVLPLGIGLYYAVDFYFGHLIFPPRSNRSPYRLGFQLDRLLVVAFIAGQFAVGFWLGQSIPGRVMPLGVLVPLVVFMPWMIWVWFMGFVSFLQHTHPRIAWYDNEKEWSFYHVQLKSTTHVVFPWPIERLLHNIMDHPAHHIDPSIPLYELPPSQKDLETQAPAHSVIIPWSLGEFFRICRACKLYDYRRHCWLDFAGRPTTPTGLHGLPMPHSVVQEPIPAR